MIEEKIEIWQETKDYPEGETVPWYGICRRCKSGDKVYYRALTKNASLVCGFLSKLNLGAPEDCHVADIMDDFVTSLYLPAVGNKK